MTLDYRDSKIDPHSGFVVEAGSDLAGLGGDAHFVRGNLHTAYYVPLERQPATGLGPQVGSERRLHGLLSGGQEQIIDRFFLGGDNLRGFEIGGAGPHDAVTGDPLGGRLIWTQPPNYAFRCRYRRTWVCQAEPSWMWVD